MTQVVSGDLLCDIAPVTLASSHCTRGALVTALLAPRRSLLDPDTGKPTPPEVCALSSAMHTTPHVWD